MFDNMTYGDFSDFLFSMASLNNLGYSLGTTIFSYRQYTVELLAKYTEKLNTALAENDFNSVAYLSSSVVKCQTEIKIYNELLDRIATFKSVTEKEEG